MTHKDSIGKLKTDWVASALAGPAWVHHVDSDGIARERLAQVQMQQAVHHLASCLPLEGQTGSLVVHLELLRLDAAVGPSIRSLAFPDLRDAHEPLTDHRVELQQAP